ncbi:MAG: transposase [Pseudomonadota bacterium]|nr:transposase [Pseudomonadota bacterium]
MDSATDNAMHQHRHEGDEYRRTELITGSTRRRQWTADEKAAAIAESLQPGVNVSALARRRGINRGLLQTWRREALREAAAPVAAFVPVRLAEGSPARGASARADTSLVPSSAEPVDTYPPTGSIEIEGGGLRVRFSGSLDVAALHAVLAHVGRRT